MPKIQVLDKEVAELIAAGEVVERPSSVIKELVENSIDAGATVITVETRRGGRTYMRVTDNGCGMEPEEVPTAFLRHATSKITGQEDLDAIGTLGFRGEALAAISAVSRVELLTRTPRAETGLRYTREGSGEPQVEEAGCPEGTTIVVRDLFFNTPARMKFLKKDVTEGNSVAGILDRIALSHPEISFRFLRDAKEVLHTPGDGELGSALYAVYGKEFFSTLIPMDYTLGGIRVHGFVSKPAGSRANRSMQSFFINGRYVRSNTASVALSEACKGMVMVGKFPACALHLELSTSAVDVNVHPAKMEIRFADERPVFDVVYYGVKSALEGEDGPKVMDFNQVHTYKQMQPGKTGEQTVIPITDAPGACKELGYTMVNGRREFILTEPAVDEPAGETAPPSAESAADAFREEDDGPEISVPRLGRVYGSGNLPALHPEKKDFHLLVGDALEQRPAVPSPQKVVEVDKSPEEKDSDAEPDVHRPAQRENPPEKEETVQLPVQPVRDFHGRIVGEAFGTYILVEYSPKALMLIDKHAAHERLLYEKLKANGPECAAQTLLEPEMVSLEKEEYDAVLANREQLGQAGFAVEDYGPGTVLVRAAPLLLDGGDAGQALMEIAGYLTEQKTDLTTRHMDWVYHNVACRAAIKAGDPTHPEELVALCRQLEENPQVRYCPHGRPVYVLLPRREIEKEFGRT